MHTAITFAAISGVVMALIGVLMAKPALELMGTPAVSYTHLDVYKRQFLFTLPLITVALIAIIIGRKIKQEQKMIGTLSALGYTKRQLMWHYKMCIRDRDM